MANEKKLAGSLYLDLTQLSTDVAKANTMLLDIGKNIVPDLEKNIAKAIQNGVSNGIAGVKVPDKLSSSGGSKGSGGGSSGGTRNASAYAAAVAALKEQQRYASAVLQINKQLVTAEGQQKNLLEQSKAEYVSLGTLAAQRAAAAKSQVTDATEIAKIEQQENQNLAKN